MPSTTVTVLASAVVNEPEAPLVACKAAAVIAPVATKVVTPVTAPVSPISTTEFCKVRPVVPFHLTTALSVDETGPTTPGVVSTSNLCVVGFAYTLTGV